MGEFEDKLNGILNNPAEMEKIMMLARSFMGTGGNSPTMSPPPPTPPQYPPHGANYHVNSPHATHYQPPPSPAGYANTYYPPPPTPPPQQFSPPPAAGFTAEAPNAAGGLDSILGGIDLNMMKKLAQGLSGGAGSTSAGLLQAMQTHLKEDRQGQLKRAFAIAQMLKAAKAIFD